MDLHNKTISLGSGLQHLYKPEGSKIFHTDSNDPSPYNFAEPFDSGDDISQCEENKKETC